MLLNDANLQNAFERDGFVVLDNFFSTEEIARLRNILESFEQHTEASLGGKGDTINDVEKGVFLPGIFRIRIWKKKFATPSFRKKPATRPQKSSRSSRT